MCLDSRQAGQHCGPFLTAVVISVSDTNEEGNTMDWKLELVILPVSDVDKAKAFYADQVGFTVDYDHTVSEEIRFVQITPPGSACSIAFGKGLVDGEPGSVKGLQVVVADAQQAHDELAARGVAVTDVEVLQWGSFVHFEDPDGNHWALQQLPRRS
jgi:predicted enzyme related to lactoylglutathione lyase